MASFPFTYKPFRSTDDDHRSTSNQTQLIRIFVMTILSISFLVSFLVAVFIHISKHRTNQLSMSRQEQEQQQQHHHHLHDE